jgi:hypothetical protein
LKRSRISAALLALVLGLGAADAARGEAKWIEAAGVARAEPGEGKGGPGRAAALRAALSEAVQMVAVELLTASETAPGKPPPDPAAIGERVAKALGGDPSVYIARYQIREDRGVQPRLLLSDPEAKAEYQLVVMAQVDVAKVRQRVGARAAPAPAPEATEAAATLQPETAQTPEGEFSTFDVEIEQITSYKEYAAVRDALLGKIGARRAQPVEFSRGRAVLTVESPVPAQDLGRALSRALDGQLGVEPVVGGVAAPGDGRLRLRVRAPAIAPKPHSN